MLYVLRASAIDERRRAEGMADGCEGVRRLKLRFALPVWKATHVLMVEAELLKRAMYTASGGSDRCHASRATHVSLLTLNCCSRARA